MKTIFFIIKVYKMKLMFAAAAAAVWLLLLLGVLAALRKNRRPTLRLLKDLQGRRYRDCGNKGPMNSYHYRWEGEASRRTAPLSAAPAAESAPPSKTLYSASGRRSRLGLYIGIGVNVVLLAVILAVLFHRFGPNTDSTPPASSAPTSTAAPAATPSPSPAPSPTPEPTPEPTSEPTPEPLPQALPLEPKVSIPGGDHGVGTGIHVKQADEDTAGPVTLTFWVNDKGTGECLFYQENVPVDKEEGFYYQFTEPNNYIVNACLVNANGEAGPTKVLDFHIYQ